MTMRIDVPTTSKPGRPVREAGSRATTSSRPSACADGGPVATTAVSQTRPQRTRTTVAPPSVATSRSPARIPADDIAAPVSRRMLSVPGCGLPGVPRSAR